MRAAGLLIDPADVVSADHVCWVYADDDEFADVARRYLTDGLSRGERLLWIGPVDVATVRTSSGPLADLDGLLADGSLRVLDLRTGYASSGRFTPEEQLAFYRAATGEAIADGHTGLRVVAEITALAADPAGRAELVQWEHLADEFMGSGSGMRALCAYREDLGPEALADVACVHPFVRPGDDDPPFRVWFDGPVLVFEGTLDTFGAGRLDRVLRGTHVAGPVVCADLGRVDFVDVGGCRTLARWADRLQQRGSRLELAGTSGVFRRMWRILGFDELVGVDFEVDFGVEVEVAGPGPRS